MEVLSFPLKFSAEGDFIRVDDTSDTYKAEQVRAFVSTHKGERALFPSFGTDDPTFDDFTGSTLVSEFVNFYDTSVVIDHIDVIKKQGAVSNIEVNFL